MKIRRKADIEQFKMLFWGFSKWDGSKHYISVADEKLNGTFTLMQYEDGTYTMHRSNAIFSDIHELPVEWGEVWRLRRAINIAIK